MSLADHLQMQLGGLHTAVLPYQQTDPIHRGTLGGVLRDAIQHEAKVHGAAFDHAGFRNVMKAMATGDVEVLFFAAAWDVCEPKIIGATINYRSLSLQRQGDDLVTRHGVYSEDVCILPRKIRELITELPKGHEFPDDGLGSHFIRGSMDYFAGQGMRGGVVPAAQTFEFAPLNTKIVKIQEQLGTNLGDKRSGLLRFEDLTGISRHRWTVPVELLAVPLVDGKIDPNNFVVRWTSADGQQKIDAAFTKGISTFTGKTITQGQFISNGRPSDTAMVESVMVSILSLAEDEIGLRRWGKLDNQTRRQFSPSIPWGGSSRDIHRALLAILNDELSTRRPYKHECPIFGVKPPVLHVHVLNEPEILAGLRSLGGQNRMLGPNSMQTASLDITKSIASNCATRPLNLIRAETATAPLFSFAA